MNHVYAQSERVITVKPEEVYATLIDYQNKRPAILTPNFVDYMVEEGGMGEGTVVRYRLQAAGRERPYRMRVAESVKGQVLTERDTNSSLVTTWTLTPAHDGQQTKVRLASEWVGGSGIGGFFERTFAPLGLRRIYADILSRLAQMLVSVPSSGSGKAIAPAAPRGKVYLPNPKRSSANALGSSEENSVAKETREARDRENVGRPAEVYLRAAVLGIVAGLRSMMPLALLSWTSGTNEDATTAPSRLLQSPVSRLVTTLAAVGEVVADKLPVIPSRISPGPLAGRLVIGGFGGMILCRRAHLPLIVGIVTGALGASAGAVGGYYSRTWLSKATKIPDPLWGGLEDILALSLGFLAVHGDRLRLLLRSPD